MHALFPPQCVSKGAISANMSSRSWVTGHGLPTGLSDETVAPFSRTENELLTCYRWGTTPSWRCWRTSTRYSLNYGNCVTRCADTNPVHVCLDERNGVLSHHRCPNPPYARWSKMFPYILLKLGIR